VNELITIGLGFVAGLAVGRWWILIAAVALGAWIGLATEVDDVPPVLLGASYAVLAATGLAGGVALRRFRT